MFFYEGDRIREKINNIKKEMASSTISDWYRNIRRNKNGLRILNWYRNIKIQDIIKYYIENKDYLEDIDIRDYYISEENTWDYLGLEDDICIELERVDLLIESKNKIINWYRKIKGKNIESKSFEHKETQTDNFEIVTNEEIENKGFIDKLLSFLF